MEPREAQADAQAAVHGRRPVPGAEHHGQASAIALLSISHCSPGLFSDLPSGTASLTR